MKKINYLLVACSHRAQRDANGSPPGKDVLKLHLEQLLKTDLTSLSQITIVRPLPLDRGLYSNEYWDIEELINQLRKSSVIVEELDVVDSWWSYSAWIQAIQKYQNQFDYYILMEDDFYPAHPDFANLLVKKHQELLPNGGYLGSFYKNNHMALSNGIVDAKTTLESFARYSNPLDVLPERAQYYFGHAFFENKMADFTDEYRCLRWAVDLHELNYDETQKRNIDIINPIQYLFDKTIMRYVSRKCQT